MSWGGFPTQDGLEKSEVDSRPQRTGTRDSDMSDEFFGFTSSKSSKVVKDADDPLLGGLLSSSVAKPNVSEANEPFSDDSDLFSVSSEKTNRDPAIVKTSTANEDDLFSVKSAKDENKTKNVEPLVGKDTTTSLFTAHSPGDDIFSAVDDKTSEKKVEPSLEKTPSKAAESKISSPLDNEELFSAVQNNDNDVAKAKTTKPEAKITAKEKAPDLDEDLFASSSAGKDTKHEKKESEKTSADKKISTPLGDDDDLFTVSTTAKKEIKTVADSAAKKTASPQTTKKTTTKASSILNVSYSCYPHFYCRSSFWQPLLSLSRIMAKPVA